MASTSHLPAELRRYVDQLVRQYMEKRPASRDVSRPATDSPVLDVDMMEEDRLAWQQIAAGMRKSPDGDHPMLGDQDDVTGDDWESLDNEDFLMGEADPDHPVDTAAQRQVLMQQPDLTSANRQADAPAAQRQLGQQENPRVESVSRQTGSTATQRQLILQAAVAAQTQESADDPDWQLVAARWWRQQRQQLQPQ